VSAAVLLDSSPVGLWCHPRTPAVAQACRRWVSDLQTAGRRVILPEIVDYEVRRELVRLNSQVALGLLDQLGSTIEYLPLTTTAMRLAADLWAQARAGGWQTASDHALDGDVILAAQALSMNTAVVVATGNPAHLTRYVPAELWSNIVP
jgi:predicted nucleic acid-binding protein